MKYQVTRAEAQKSWTTGGNLGGGGSGLASTGLGGGAGAGSLVPQWGGTKADDLFTIIFVKVDTGATAVILYEKNTAKSAPVVEHGAIGTLTSTPRSPNAIN